MSDAIGTLQEGPLYAALKRRYRNRGDDLEVDVGGCVVDILGPAGITEIQTSSFSAVKRKLTELLQSHPVRLVYPVGAERWIVRMDVSDEVLGRRKFSWQVAERHLLEVLDVTTIACADHLFRILPRDLPDPFSTHDLAQAMQRPIHLAQKAAYCLRESGAVRLVGKRGNRLPYAR